MMPAQECFRPIDAAIRSDLWLVVEFKLPLQQRLSELLLQFHAGCHDGLHFGIVEAQVVPA